MFEILRDRLKAQMQANVLDSGALPNGRFALLNAGRLHVEVLHYGLPEGHPLAPEVLETRSYLDNQSGDPIVSLADCTQEGINMLLLWANEAKEKLEAPPEVSVVPAEPEAEIVEEVVAVEEVPAEVPEAEEPKPKRRR